MVKAGKKSNSLILVSEGDSWYDYPGYNMIDHIEKKLREHKVKYKILRLEENGDEAVAMLARRKRHKLANLLSKHGDDIHVFFFDGGGNDIAGKWDMPFIIRQTPDPDEPDPVKQWINAERLDRRMQQIENAYRDLVDLRDDYSPSTTIITHTYDQAIPNGKKASFLLGLLKSGPWLKPYMKHIPEDLHQSIIDVILGRIEPIVSELAKTKKKFKIARTTGTLKRDEKLWANELHPTKKGFEMVGDKLWNVLIKVPAVKARL